MSQLALFNKEPDRSPISPLLEMGAYEALWLKRGASFKSIAEKFADNPEALPSDFVSSERAQHCAQNVVEKLKDAGVHKFGVRIHHAGDYPAKLRDARHPIELLYFRGAWELSELPSVAVVGSRKASPDGQVRAKKLARALVERNYAVTSGLAAGIDSSAHEAALEAGGRTIAVVGTPLGEVYPSKNRELQEQIASEHLLISQVPVLRYSNQEPRQNRLFFPERNATMSALTLATVIVEAGETSGSLIQARAALYQKRKLFILESCFQRSDLTWPARFEQKGAIRVREPDDIWKSLE